MGPLYSITVVVLNRHEVLRPRERLRTKIYYASKSPLSFQNGSIAFGGRRCKRVESADSSTSAPSPSEKMMQRNVLRLLILVRFPFAHSLLSSDLYFLTVS